MRAVVAGLALCALAGCMHQKEVAASKEARAACDAQTFKTMTELARCQVQASELSRPAWGQNASLFELANAQKLVLAEKVDRGQITRAEYDLEIAKIKANFAAIDQERKQRAMQALADGLGQAADNMARNQAIANANRPINCTSTGLGNTVNTTCY